MKLIVTCTDTIYDWRKEKHFPGVIDALQEFKDMGEDYDIILVSNHRHKLKVVPNGFKKLNLSNAKRLRKSRDLIDYISEKFSIEIEDVLILGAKDDDMILAANSKVLLLTAEFAKDNNPDDRIYSEAYGIGILSVERLEYFFKHYLNVESPWFCSYRVNSCYYFYGLTNAMTNLMRDKDEAEICNHLRKHLKNGHAGGKNPFRVYSLISMYRIFKEVNDINYWGYYPSSDGQDNDALNAIKDILRKSFNSRTTKPILIRHTKSAKRNRLAPIDRASSGCDSQFDSIHLNPYYKNKIKGKNFCIIDDFSTHGTSSETVRHLLESEGANKIVFICLGKYKYTYKKYDYTLSGDLYAANYTYTRNGRFSENKVIVNNPSQDELMDSLRDAFHD